MKILFNMVFEFTADHRAAVQALAPELEIVISAEPDPDKLDGTDVAVLVTEPVPRNLEKWPQLRWVQLLSAGSNHLKDHPIWQTNIAVTNGSGTHGVPIAQYITVTWLMMMHRMTELLKFKDTHKWPNRAALANDVVRDLTVGIIGYGAIGRESARQLSSLGMNVLCLKRYPVDRVHRGFNPWPGSGDPEGTIPKHWFSHDQLADMLPLCDLVVVTVPSTKDTDGMIGPAELALMKPGSRMIVISRGGIVQEAALADALRKGPLAEAVVDCFVKEPIPPDHFFFDVPNLIMTPHMSGVFSAYWPVLFKLVEQNLGHFKNDRALLNTVSRQNGY
jgi:phosphoglycerate dehydrogenase-like enzyme